ncbi:phage tail assembly protein [Luteibacter aegosomatis]|uniref:phage tail assembly protein n=1 Tax=Luteibacter aegosomatis TaxID=2911537 RepID=UPI001FF83AA7|nr:phage tail assembly protein [Luteibacter aegosomatis]UPG86857.1 phage tail assembly protein [Luteibacter aegosomatis]
MHEDEITIELIKPVLIGKGEGAIEYTELKLREPVAGELEKASMASTAIGSQITLISLVAKVPRGAVEKLCQRDLQAASRVLNSFTDGGQEIPTDGDD